VQSHIDWWGYKWEAFQAIPYGFGMLHRAGVNTTIISDSGDIMRRLNREAAKVVKYNGIGDDEALAMITINAARALEIDNRTGSITVGKDADFAIFDRHPLDSFSKCVMTVIEGNVWFDINNIDNSLLD
jgi:imidazolonepropionase-like amidohydrolase